MTRKPQSFAEAVKDSLDANEELMRRLAKL